MGAVLNELGVRPSRGLGQNFLVDANILRILVEAAACRAAEPVLEIGPGLGTVTAALLERGAAVTAVEKDHRLAAWLRRRFAGQAGFHLVEADMLDVALPGLPGAPFRTVVSNLPYRDGSRILVNLLREPDRPGRMVLTVQKEVADRLASPPGKHDFGLLTLWTGLHYQVELLHKVGPRCFFPVPAVASGIVRLVAHPGRAPSPGVTDRYMALTRAAFRHRRKQLAGIVRTGDADWPFTETQCRAWLRARGLDPDCRPAVLSVDDWLALASLT